MRNEDEDEDEWLSRRHAYLDGGLTSSPLLSSVLFPSPPRSLAASTSRTPLR